MKSFYLIVLATFIFNFNLSATETNPVTKKIAIKTVDHFLDFKKCIKGEWNTRFETQTKKCMIVLKDLKCYVSRVDGKLQVGECNMISGLSGRVLKPLTGKNAATFAHYLKFTTGRYETSQVTCVFDILMGAHVLEKCSWE